MVEVCASYDLDWRDDVSGSVVQEGDVIDLGNVEVHIVETPGHSSCAVTAYIPGIRALFPSDAGGIPHEETIVTSGNSNYTKYQESLEKLRDLQVDYYCADHYGYITGTKARGFISQCIEAAQAHRKGIEETFQETGSIDETVRVMVGGFLAENPDYLLTPDILEGIYGQMVKHIAKNMG
jgi:glyoxylase-like metal-dependent hydrolase (beta-lactamase superfamily II)